MSKKRYVAITMLCGFAMQQEPVPLEVSVSILDENMALLDSYSTPISPDRDLSLVMMHTSNYLVDALEREGLWSVIEVNSMDVQSADRYISDKITKGVEEGDVVVVLTDVTSDTQRHIQRFFATTNRKLERHKAMWIEVEPVKNFAERFRLLKPTHWPYRSAGRVKQIISFAHMFQGALNTGFAAMKENNSGR